MRNDLNQCVEFTSTAYCKISKCLLSILGLWPGQKLSQSVILTITAITVLGLCAITQIVNLIKNFADLEEVSATLPPLLTVCVSLAKYTTFIFNRNYIREMFYRLNEDWRTIKPEKEMQIMERYLKDGSLYSLGYCILVYVTIITFILLMFGSYVYEKMAPLNESRPLQTIYPADYYFINKEEYFFLITCHMIVGSFFLVIILTAADTTLIIFIQYVCAMFCILGNRLENTMYEHLENKNIQIRHQTQIYIRCIAKCVAIHRKILEFVGIIEFTFSISHLIQLLLNIICLSVTLLQVVLLWGQLELIRYILYATAQLFHIFYISYQGQQLIDHSLQISNRIYNGVWYDTPQEVQKLLLFILRKSATVSCITAGKMANFSIETFSMIVHNSMSYFMVLSSMQE